jgi:hypothetical protein
VSTPQHPEDSETTTTGNELVKYEPYLELVSRLWFATAAKQNRLTATIDRMTRLNRSQVIFLEEPVTWATLPQRLAERRRDYAEYFASRPVTEPASLPRGFIQRSTPQITAAVAEAVAGVFTLRPYPDSAPIAQRDNDTHTPEGKHR